MCYSLKCDRHILELFVLNALKNSFESTRFENLLSEERYSLPLHTIGKNSIHTYKKEEEETLSDTCLLRIRVLN